MCLITVFVIPVVPTCQPVVEHRRGALCFGVLGHEGEGVKATSSVYANGLAKKWKTCSDKFVSAHAFYLPWRRDVMHLSEVFETVVDI